MASFVNFYSCKPQILSERGNLPLHNHRGGILEYVFILEKILEEVIGYICDIAPYERIVEMWAFNFHSSTIWTFLPRVGLDETVCHAIASTSSIFAKCRMQINRHRHRDCIVLWFIVSCTTVVIETFSTDWCEQGAFERVKRFFLYPVFANGEWEKKPGLGLECLVMQIVGTTSNNCSNHL